MRTKWERLLAWHAFVACLFALFAGGCEEDVVAVTGTDVPFSLFGVLSPQLDTQWVRVFAVEGRLEPTPPGPLDARLTSLDRDTGEERLWHDSLIAETGGLNAHVFWTPFVADFGHTYRLEARRSDGARSLVEVTMPPRTELEMPPQLMLPPSLLPVRVVGAAPNLIRIEAAYEYLFRSFAGIERGRIVLSYDGKQRQTPEGWVIDIRVVQDLRAIREIIEETLQLDLDPSRDFKMVKLTLRLIVANEEWSPPGGVFDADVLVQPETMTNVENGFGFVGAGYRLAGTWRPLDTLIVGKAY